MGLFDDGEDFKTPIWITRPDKPDFGGTSFRFDQITPRVIDGVQQGDYMFLRGAQNGRPKFSLSTRGRMQFFSTKDEARLVLKADDGSVLAAKLSIGGIGGGRENPQSSIFLYNSIKKAKCRIGGSARDGEFKITNASDLTTMSVNGATARMTLGNTGVAGTFEIAGNDDQAKFSFSAKTGKLSLGGNGAGADLQLRTKHNEITAVLQADSGTLRLGGNGINGDIFVRSRDNQNVFKVDSRHGNVTIGGRDRDGDLNILSKEEKKTFWFSGDSASLRIGGEGTNAKITMRAASNDSTITMQAETGSATFGGRASPGRLSVNSGQRDLAFDMDGKTATLQLGAHQVPGHLKIAGRGPATLSFRADTGNLKLGGFDLRDQFGVSGKITLTSSRGTEATLRNDSNGFALLTENSGGQPVAQLSIDPASGLVAIPNKTAETSFHATYDGPDLLNSSVILFATETADSPDYNPATGRFTAPVSGRYRFWFRGQISAGKQHIWLVPKVNGTDVAESLQAFVMGAENSSASGELLLQLNQGDTVEIENRVFAGTYGMKGMYNGFGGYLIGR